MVKRVIRGWTGAVPSNTTIAGLCVQDITDQGEACMTQGEAKEVWGKVRKAKVTIIVENE